MSPHARRVSQRVSALVTAALLLVAPLTTAVTSPAWAGAPVSSSATTPPTDDASSREVYVVSLHRAPRDTDPSAMRATQDRLLAAVGRPEVLYRFDAALNGFAARLTPDQVQRLRAEPAVELVERSTTHRIDSVDSTEALDLPSAWDAVGGPRRAGAGTVVGFVDTGIWPESPSFAALPGSGALGKHEGGCQTGEQWDAADCNSKVVTARWFVEGFGPGRVAAAEYLSPRDSTGHGSAVAGVAAGNHEVRVNVGGRRLGTASGMAPAARIAVYKACWTAPDPADDGCATADLVAAVDSAVADRVDVLSFPVSGPDSTTPEVLQRSLLNATAAGVFVAMSAGNGGPTGGSVSDAGPWVTTAAASRHHTFAGAVVLGDGSRHVGATISGRNVRAPLVLAEQVAAPRSTGSDARLCRPGSLDPASVDGRIVVCERGVVPRVDKSAAVAQAGGVGMVLVNSRPDSTDPDFHAVPTVHLDVAAGRAVRRYVEGTVDPRATLRAGDRTRLRQGEVAPFSARGPVDVMDGTSLNPDLTAPGVGVVAPTAPPASDGRAWDVWTGTSMATAHLAGLAALLVAERPGWSPAMVRSAMSTTAVDVAAGGGSGGPLAVGSGLVDADAMLDPGVVLDARPARYRAWLAGRGRSRALNLPSVMVDDLVGRARVVRRVTSVSRRSETYQVRVRGLAGFDTAVRPSTLTLRPGETGRVVVRLVRTSAPLDTPARGRILLTGPRHRARLPVVAVPRSVSAPAEARGSGSAGTVSYEATAGRDGRQRLAVSGLVPAEPVPVSLRPGRFHTAEPRTDADTMAVPLDVPRDARALRVELSGRDNDDVDLYLYRAGELVATATGSGGDETLTLLGPAPGDYRLYVSSVVAENGATTTSQLHTWVVGPRDAGNLAAPRSVPVDTGEPFRVELSWRGLDPTARWFGVVRYPGSDSVTLVGVN